MNVVVTKDLFGVSIWDSRAELEYKPAFKNFGSPPVWMAKNCWFQSKWLLLSKGVLRRMFPNLGDEMAEGERKDARIDVSIS